MTRVQVPTAVVPSRRTVIRGVGAALVALGCTVSGVTHLSSLSGTPVPNAPGMLDRVRDLVTDDAHDAEVLGRLFLAENEWASDAETISTLLEHRLKHAELPAGENSVRALIERRIDEDFDAGETVLLDGWLVSMTETILFAYVALTASY